jgi:hypothetical protein
LREFNPREEIMDVSEVARKGYLRELN